MVRGQLMTARGHQDGNAAEVGHSQGGHITCGPQASQPTTTTASQRMIRGSCSQSSAPSMLGSPTSYFRTLDIGSFESAVGLPPTCIGREGGRGVEGRPRRSPNAPFIRSFPLRTPECFGQACVPACEIRTGYVPFRCQGHDG